MTPHAPPDRYHRPMTTNAVRTSTGTGTVPRFTLPDRVRKAREVAHLTQTAAATELGITRQAINGYEAGRVTPRRPFLLALAALAGVSDHWLITGDDGPCPNATATGACGCKVDSLDPIA